MVSVSMSLALMVSVAAQAQPGSNEQRVETAHVVVTAQPVAAPVARGARVTLRLDVTPKPKMHLYSPEQRDYIPISIEIEKNPAVTIKPAVFPKAEKYFFKALDETQLVYSKPFQIVQPLVVATSAKPGTAVVVNATVEYQACDESVCYRPLKLRVSWELTLR